jgi:hypothetical protein
LQDILLEENKKYISVKKIYQNAKKIIGDWLGKIKIYKIEKFNSIFSTDEGSINKEKFNMRKEIQNWMFKDSIEIFQGLIEFIEGLIARKINF